MFDWLVLAINNAIGEDKNCAASVGVLDIYGFESFDYNDLEQFCINLANEKLQQHFNHHVFKQEQAEYEREEIDWSYIEFVDNQDVLDLIEGKMGILDLLDETCRFPTSTNKDLSEKLYASSICQASARFKRPKLSNTAFTIEHYAGPVSYQSDNFLEKNKDFVVAEHQSLLQASTRDFVRRLFPAEGDATSADGAAAPAKRFAAFKFNSVGSQFKRQLGELMTLLARMEPHYIRCIKPNSANAPALFENANVLHQLRCGGVLEAVRISCAGFPNKRPFPDFVEHFWPLAPDLYHQPDLSDRDIALAILERSGISSGEGYQLGVSKVFLRAGQMAILDKQRTERLTAAATVIQRYARGHLARVHFRQAKVAVLTLQSGARGMLARKRAREMRQDRAALAIQTAWRRHKLREEYKTVYGLVVGVQALWRGIRARDAYARLRAERAATVLQSNWRRWVAAQDFARRRAAATTLQNAWRYQQLDDRLDAIERALIDIFKRGGRGAARRGAGGTLGAPGAPGAGAGARAAAGAAGGSGAARAGRDGSGSRSGEESGESEGEDAAGVLSEGVGGAIFDISKLQSSVVETLNSGHLEAIKTLRETLMAHEWELHGKRLAMHRGVANFEHYCALQKLEIDYSVVSELYRDPTNLAVIPDARLRCMARSMIEQAVDDRYLSLYAECTSAARDLASANLTSRLPIPVPGAGAVSGVAGVVRCAWGALRGALVARARLRLYALGAFCCAVCAIVWGRLRSAWPAEFSTPRSV
ncbi:myosin [Raphidocelis subcapitata]|uniref:Myosin n=1 Tax=Raphidocelis subcapitata TaxID=307507 RepID=A0A2V0PLH9_9CHLO|nr:myosin [Raphidocelis subcapitata]|eukprot:GBG00632.1 myosin [Raphidocelis subcapitata]